MTIGARVRLQTKAYITAWSVVEDDVFVAPAVVLTNDPTAGRRAAGGAARAMLRGLPDGDGAVLLPGVEIGRGGLRGGRGGRDRDVRRGRVVMGVPARAVREVPEEELLLRRRWRVGRWPPSAATSRWARSPGRRGARSSPAR